MDTGYFGEMRAMIRIILLGVVLTTGACYSYRPVATAPRPGATVRIVLVSATDVRSIAPDRTQRAHPGVLEASGTIQAAAADTVTVRLGELRTAVGAIPDVAERIVLLPTDRIAKIEERRFQAGQTALAGVGVASLVLTGFLIAIIVVLTRTM